ncbi:hypothetical protein [Streptomyces catenulae]|uniref:Uncharacterized protein n=1 Tax=Streptomyces catenulae TaxID=66875 RepID=A0ABV2Z6P5_9ACTN|nr:hypothetical protein [Streptomyces catenulae]
MAQRPDLPTRIADALNSKALGSAIGIVSLAATAVAWAVDHVNLMLIIVLQTVLNLVFVLGGIWSGKTHIRLRRTNSIEAMDEPMYYDAIRAQLENSLVSDYRRIADGYLSVHGTEVPWMSVQLINALLTTDVQPRRIQAIDRTTNPSLLTRRRAYLDANQRFIEDGGRINRLFVVKRENLLDRDFAHDLLALIDHHRQLGVICGLAVREDLRPQETVDTVVFGNAAVLIEDEQGDETYTQGRSTILFKGIDVYIGHFTRAWEHGLGAPRALHTYETAIRPLLDAWDAQEAAAVVDGL